MSISTIPIGTLNCLPIYAYHLPLTQRRILFASLLQNPVAILIIERHRGFTNLIMIELCHLFYIYCIICLTHTCLCSSNIPPVYTAAMQITITKVHACILDLLHEEEFTYIVNNLPRMAVSPILTLLLQGMSEVDHHLYFNNVAISNPPLWSSAPSPTIPVLPLPSDREDIPSTIINQELHQSELPQWILHPPSCHINQSLSNFPYHKSPSLPTHAISVISNRPSFKEDSSSKMPGVSMLKKAGWSEPSSLMQKQ